MKVSVYFSIYFVFTLALHPILLQAARTELRQRLFFLAF